jgi:hypothetical protein
MPLFYTVVPGATQTTNATPNTTNDCLFVAPGATRTVWLKAIYPEGRGVNLTSISGITYRLEKWTSTASSGGSAITPSPVDPGYQAAKHTAGFAAGAVTPGTGGPTLMLSIGSGTTSPGNWIAPSLDEAFSLQAAATQSLDVFNISGAASLIFELSVGTVE